MIPIIQNGPQDGAVIIGGLPIPHRISATDLENLGFGSRSTDVTEVLRATHAALSPSPLCPIHADPAEVE